GNAVFQCFGQHDSRPSLTRDHWPDALSSQKLTSAPDEITNGISPALEGTPVVTSIGKTAADIEVDDPPDRHVLDRVALMPQPRALNGSSPQYLRCYYPLICKPKGCNLLAMPSAPRQSAILLTLLASIGACQA